MERHIPRVFYVKVSQNFILLKWMSNFNFISFVDVTGFRKVPKRNYKYLIIE